MFPQVTIHFTLLPILYGLRGRVACEAHHNWLLLAPSIRWDLAATIWAHTIVCISWWVWVAHMSRIICAQYSTASHLAQVCTQTVHTCNNAIGLSQWVWINPIFLCLHIKSTQSMQLQKNLYSFSAVDTSKRDFQSPLWILYTLPGQQYSHKTTSETTWKSLLGW